AAGDDAGTFDALNNVAVFSLATVAGGSSGTVNFQVRVGQQAVTNTASATYQTVAGTDSVASNPVQTAVVAPEVSLLKTLIGPSTAGIGDAVQYQMIWSNASPTAVVSGAMVTDTIPAGLEYVSSLPAAVLSGRVLQWSLGDLAAGSTGQIQLTLAVAATVTDTQRVSNTAVLSSGNAPEQSSTASEVLLVGPASRELSLTKTADVVEVSLGETAPFTLVVGNRGVVDLSDIQIHDRLPEGTRYAKGTATGVDSVRSSGRDLTFFVAGPLAPGDDHSVHYAVAVVSASSTTLENTAFAVAGGVTRSANAVASLRVNRSWAMQDRAVIGKVWVDANNNGIQDFGEGGMPGVDVWTEDGDIATTDTDGRFSFRNMQPGTQHAFRPDLATVPAGYQLADSGVERLIVTRDATGWTTPRVDFRLIPNAARMTGVLLPIGWSMSAQAIAVPVDTATTVTRLQQRDSVAEHGYLDIPPVEVRSVEFASNKSVLSPAAIGMLDTLAPWFNANPELSVILRGHTDAVGSAEHNRQLSEERAKAVMQQLVAAGVDPSRLIPVAFGATSPVAGNQTAEGRARNRRVELRIVYATQIREVDDQIRVLSAEPPAESMMLEVGLQNSYGIPWSGLSVTFPVPLDSAELRINDSVVGRAAGVTVALPVIPAHAAFVLRGWSRRPDAAASAELSLNGSALSRLEVALADSVVRVAGVTAPAVTADSLPDLAALPPGGAVAVTLSAPVAGWQNQTSFLLPSGWRAQTDSAAPVPAPANARVVEGGEALTWKLPEEPTGPMTLMILPGGAVAPSAPARLEPLRPQKARLAEQQNAFLTGPGVEIFSPTDGSILKSDRAYIGVRGEPGAPVTLFDGDSVLAEARLRPDGVQDFIAVALQPGPHRLRVRMMNSWSNERWDSSSVHVTGAPASFHSEQQRVALVADGQTIATARVRVLDAWGVPVVNGPQVTVVAEGAEVVNPDMDGSSVGVQVAADAAGWLTILLRPGHAVGAGSVQLSYATLHGELPLDILPAVQPLLLTGSGLVGIGASYQAYGAVTARGHLDDRTSFLVSYDSRRLDAGTDAFARSADPLAEAQYPILGDASVYRTSSASTYQLSARVERGYDWLAFGDIGVNGGLGSELGLSDYRRALPGLAARYTTGPVVWQGFGAVTTQLLQQTQIRGAGSSGPYTFGSTIRFGTEQVTVETRERNNAEHILSREVLTRFVDYDINYESGSLLLKRPVPAADTYGNPVYLVVIYEAESGGASSEVWGLRAAVDGTRWIRSTLLDSARVGATWVHESPDAGGHQLLGADLHLVAQQGLTLGGEVSFSNGPDSSGTATALAGSYGFLGGAGQLTAKWLGVSREFGNPANPALQGGTSAINLGAQYKRSGREFQLGYNWQRFDVQDQERQEARASVLQPIGSDVQVLGSLASHRFLGPNLNDDVWGAEAKVSWKPEGRLGMWTEGRVDLGGTGASQSPSFVGVGASYDVTSAVSLEARHRRAFLPGDSGSYSVTDLGVRTRIGTGTEAYGSYQLAGISGADNAALVGLRNRLQVGSSWTLNTLFERRMGLNAAGTLDPVRAAPFLQQEENYWSVGAGAEYLPQLAPYRLSARAEFKDGDINSNRLLSLAGDVSLSSGLALLTRQNVLKTEQTNSDTTIVGHAYGSLWGVAFRPTRSNKLNVLAKFQWINVLNPNRGSVLGGSGEEGRTIVAVEGIYQPSAISEIAARVASRRSSSSLVASDGTSVALKSLADFVGVRGSLVVMPRLEARLDGRLLMERTSGESRYQLSPQLAFLPQQTLEVVTGYRFGDLQDPDFATDGGDGWFVTFSARVTEQSIASAADFWRQRFGGR
ncbi:MAG TPA: OmpA family protein, partial [Gemmatimonadales bacterium]|nr:OmpA family protein [Gemmatimonadales bacterium]